MSTNKLIALAILAVGVVLLIYGISALDSFSSDISRFFTGSPTNKTIWLMIGGVAAIVVGLIGLLRSQPHLQQHNRV
jgi:uncharacterized membrane protein YidH (DUF202 family)